MKFFGQVPALRQAQGKLYGGVTTTMIFTSSGGPKTDVQSGWQSCKSAAPAQPARSAARRDPCCFVGTFVLEVRIQN